MFTPIDFPPMAGTHEGTSKLILFICLMSQFSPLMMILIAPLSRSIMVFHTPLKMSLIPSHALSKSIEKTPEINLISPEKIVLISLITFPTVCLMLPKTEVTIALIPVISGFNFPFVFWSIQSNNPLNQSLIPSITAPIAFPRPLKIPAIPFVALSISPVKIPAKKSINPFSVSLTPSISSCPCPVAVVMLRSRDAIIPISKGIQDPISIPIPTPAARIPAIASIWFWKFHPFFSASVNATAKTASPETMAVIPPATGPRATYSPVTASVMPKIIPAMFSCVTPFTIESKMFCTSVSAP